jgi:hypothetical protein
MYKPKNLILLVCLVIVGWACSAPSDKASDTSRVEHTATPKPPTSTQVPETETPLPSQTYTPEPTITPTPGIVKLQDDFTSRSDIWGECENCVWENGSLYFGPFEPSGSGQDQIFYILCEACGENKYYRIAADVTYQEGYGGDRTFGILAGLGIHDVLAAGTASTSQHALYETFDLLSKRWGGTPFKVFGAVKPGLETNRIEVTISPGASLGAADIFVAVNGKTLIMLYDQEAMPSKVGLYLGWHSIGVAFDNFEYEEIEKPKKELAALSQSVCDIAGKGFIFSKTIGFTGTLTQVNVAGSIWTATVEDGGCQVPITVDIERYQAWVEERPDVFENGARVYVMGELKQIMVGEFDPTDFDPDSFIYSLEVRVLPELID